MAVDFFVVLWMYATQRAAGESERGRAVGKIGKTKHQEASFFAAGKRAPLLARACMRVCEGEESMTRVVQLRYLVPDILWETLA